MARFNSFNEIIEIIKTINFDPALPSYKEVLINIDDLSRILTVYNQFFYFLDLSTAQIIFISNNFTKMTGYENDIRNLKQFYSLILPEDRNIVIRATTCILKVWTNNPGIDFSETTFDIDFRLLMANGSYLWLSRNTSIYKKDKTGNPLFLLSVFTDLSRYKNNDIVCITCTGPCKDMFDYSNCYKLLFKNRNCTQREFQMLEGIAKGKNCNTIAEELNISIHTVHTLRRKMLSKFNPSKVNGLRAIAVQNGFILH